MTSKELEKILKGLANKRRLAIIRLLAKNNSLCVSTVASSIKLSFKATSKHLLILKQLDIVENSQRGLEVYYSLAEIPPQPVSILLKSISNSRE
ncbi:MAG: helix-turn-helix transcriptional regulator [Parcubacteria group bacterium]|nr:helix-turn-helix transcriptional regulator [Parcubacteria group bacterium]